MEKSVYENALMATAETVMAFTARGGELQSLQYCQFWADLNNPVQGSDCLASLITKLLAVATGEDKLYTLPDLMRKMVNHDFESASDQAKLTTDSSTRPPPHRAMSRVPSSDVCCTLWPRTCNAQWTCSRLSWGRSTSSPSSILTTRRRKR